MLILSSHINQWLGSEHALPNIEILTVLFFLLNFLAATQDIAVDGWALTMLKKRNVGHASTCNSVGQSVGFFLSYVVFMALESASFCNNYLRTIPQDEGKIALPIFLRSYTCQLNSRNYNFAQFLLLLGMVFYNINNSDWSTQKRSRAA